MSNQQETDSLNLYDDLQAALDEPYLQMLDKITAAFNTQAEETQREIPYPTLIDPVTVRQMLRIVIGTFTLEHFPEIHKEITSYTTQAENRAKGTEPIY